MLLLIGFIKEESNVRIVLLSLNGADSSSHQSMSRASSDHGKQEKRDERVAKPSKREGAEKQEAASGSIEEEAITAANDSLCSDNIRSVDEKGTAGKKDCLQETSCARFSIDTVGVFDILKSRPALDPY